MLSWQEDEQNYKVYCDHCAKYIKTNVEFLKAPHLCYDCLFDRYTKIEKIFNETRNHLSLDQQISKIIQALDKIGNILNQDIK